MNSRPALAATLGLALAGGGLALAAAAEPGIVWQKDFPSTLRRARQDNLLVLVDFYTSWCAFCKNLEREAFTDPRVVELSRQFAATKLDAEIHRTATNRYRPSGYPTIIFATAEGDEILRVSGYKTPDEIYRVMKSVVEIGPRVSALTARVRQDRRDWAAHEELGAIYLKNEVFTLALDHLRAATKALPPAERASAPDAESAAERIQFLAAQASAGDEDHQGAVKILEQLIAANPQSPRRADYYRALERTYVAWGKPDRAEQARRQRLLLFPESADP